MSPSTLYPSWFVSNKHRWSHLPPRRIFSISCIWARQILGIWFSAWKQVHLLHFLVSCLHWANVILQTLWFHATFLSRINPHRRIKLTFSIHIQSLFVNSDLPLLPFLCPCIAIWDFISVSLAVLNKWYSHKNSASSLAWVRYILSEDCLPQC